ncbi:hypothetical protein [Nocardia concava]|uniref:hypothetical protein n=1 Tax=Nocardia concava TaxID=257281 RepID=UPI0003199229|nr:hypothetical protein [Nocardia concava]
MSARHCAECAYLVWGFGAPDRSCDRCWREDNPHGRRIRIKFTAAEVNQEVLAVLLGERL